MTNIHRLTSVSGFLICALLTVFSSACGSSTTTSAATGIAQVQANVSPTTVNAQASTKSQYQYEVDFTANLSETGGSVAATVNQVSASVAEVVGGIAVNTGDVQSEIQVNSTSNRLNAGGTLDIPCQVFYTLPDGGTAAQVTVALSVIDDNGDQVGGDLQVNVP